MADDDEVVYRVSGRICELVLNRPERLNAISATLPERLQRAVQRANDDEAVHVIVLRGSGKGFCSGYDLKEFAEPAGPLPGSQKMPWDLMLDYQWMKKATDCFMSLFRSLKPTIAVVHGAGAIAGGSDIALCCDFIVMSETARIGYPPARVWGCPTTAMWTFRIGAEKAKRMLLTGDLIDGRTARDYGLVIDCCPEEQLAERAMQLAERVASVPQNQLMMQKLVINQIVEHMGLHHAQVMATVFDGFARHSPEGVAFKRLCEQHGFKEAVRIRDQPPAIAAKL